MESDDQSYEQELRLEKQTYLVTEIIQKGYEASDFVAFCNTKRGANIDLWEINELKAVVAEFKAIVDSALEGEDVIETPQSSSVYQDQHGLNEEEQHGRPALDQAEFQPQSEPSYAQVGYTRGGEGDVYPDLADSDAKPREEVPANPDYPRENIEGSRSSLSSIHSVDQDPSDSSAYVRMKASYEARLEEEIKSSPTSYSIPSTPTPLTPLSTSPPPTIQVSDAKVESGGMLSASFASWQIDTSPLGWTTRRRFTDFEWLHKTLLEQFPGYYVPPIPDQLKLNVHQPETLLKRTRFFERLLNSMMRNPILRRSEIVCSFLRDDPQAFKKYMSNMKKLKKQTNPAEFFNLDGQIRCDIGGVATDHSQRVSKLLNDSQSVKYRIRKKAQEVTSVLNTLSTNLRELSGLFEELEASLRVLPENRQANKALSRTMNSAFGMWSTIEGEVARQFKESFTMFYKYEVAQINSLKNLLAERDTAYSVFVKAEQKLLAKKEKLWSQGNPSKWELPPKTPTDGLKYDKDRAFSLMLYNETQQFNKIRDTYGFLNFQSNAEISRVLEETTYVDNQHFTEFCDYISRLTASISETWSEANANLIAAAKDCIPEPLFLRII